MFEDPDFEREFYSLRSRAFSAAPVSPQELASLFSENPESRPTVLCSEDGYAQHILKLGWLLGDSVRIVTPHVAFQYTHDDVTATHSYPETLAIDPEFLRWRDVLREEIEAGRIELIPSLQLNLSKTSDPIERWSNVDAQVSFCNLTQPDLVPNNCVSISTLPAVVVDLPQLPFSDFELLKKVQQDHPIAALEFQKLLRESRNAAIKQDGDKSANEVLEYIRDDIVLPGVKRIQHEQNQLLKSHAISAATEVSAISLPILLSYAASHEEFFTEILGAGVGVIVARAINLVRSDVTELKNGPFFAAMKIGV